MDDKTKQKISRKETLSKASSWAEDVSDEDMQTNTLGR